MPLRLTLGVRGTVAGHRRGALAGGYLPLLQCIPGTQFPPSDVWGTPSRPATSARQGRHDPKGTGPTQSDMGTQRVTTQFRVQTAAHITQWQRPRGQFLPQLTSPEGTLGYVTCALAANSTKRRKKMGSSVAYKTIGTFLSQNKRREDACGWATEMQSSGCAAVRQWPTLCFTHRTCKFDLISEFIRLGMVMPPPPPRTGAGHRRHVWSSPETHPRTYPRGRGRGGDSVSQQIRIYKFWRDKPRAISEKWATKLCGAGEGCSRETVDGGCYLLQDRPGASTSPRVGTPSNATGTLQTRQDHFSACATSVGN